MKKFVWASLLAGFLSLGLSACYDNDGPMEQMGEAADEAVNDTKRAIKDAAD
ncbi:hypothetical protein [Thalassobaculum sp.]|uniref:hypothetical protein n=1 Tax=Thalassobaculum sp. TaxID=2022740 RepID=UPI003B5CF8A3